MRRFLSFVNERMTSTASSSNCHGTRYDSLAWSRLCDERRPNAIQRLKTDAGGVPSNPPMSWLQKPKPDRPSDNPPAGGAPSTPLMSGPQKPNPDRPSDNPPRRLSAIDSKVDVQSPPQWTGN